MANPTIARMYSAELLPDSALTWAANPTSSPNTWAVTELSVVQPMCRNSVR